MMIGIMMIMKILVIVSTTSSCIICPSSRKWTSAKFIIKGMVNKVMKLLKAVRVTDSAVSPFARWVIRFDVGPPGQAARIISPMAISGVKGNDIAMANPISGRSINWLTRPTKIAFGYMMILLKSSITSDNPIPNIMIIREAARNIVEILSMIHRLVRVRNIKIFFYMLVQAI